MPLGKSLVPGEKLPPSVASVPPADAGTISRRQFATSIGAVALSASGFAEQHGSEEMGSRPEGLSHANWAEVQARYRNVLRVYGGRLSQTERRMMIHILITNQQMLASIQSFTLQNGDPSACTLRLVMPESH